ncbi:MAG: DNA polymerase III subunit [Candidatus Pacebacteria bacterium]|nr:DNA polymerase III subunit [Candidatus Paceibacterota bacterium]
MTEIIGHEKQRRILAKIISSGNIPHAFLFSGPQKIGKRKIALDFAKNLFCEEKIQGEACGKCYSCRKVDELAIPDLSIVETEPEAKEIKIEQIWNLSEKLALKSYGNSYKIGIIDDAHLMNLQAENALLKTLEEPRGKSVIILVSAFPDMLLPTVKSRMERIKFSLVSKEDIEKHLVSLGASSAKAKEIAMMSSGQIGKAIDFFENPEKMKLLDQAIKDIEHLCRSGFGDRFDYAKRLVEGTEDLNEILEIWERFFRRQIIYREMNESSGAKGYPVKKLIYIIKEIGKIKFLIATTNINKKMALENFLLNI